MVTNKTIYFLLHVNFQLITYETNLGSERAENLASRNFLKIHPKERAKKIEFPWNYEES